MRPACEYESPFPEPPPDSRDESSGGIDDHELEEIALNLLHVKRRGYYRAGGHRTIVAWAEEQHGLDAHGTRMLLRWARRLERHYAGRPDASVVPPAPPWASDLEPAPARGHSSFGSGAGRSPEDAFTSDVRVLLSAVAPGAERGAPGPAADGTGSAMSPRGGAESAPTRGRGAPNVRHAAVALFSSA